MRSDGPGAQLARCDGCGRGDGSEGAPVRPRSSRPGRGGAGRPYSGRRGAARSSSGRRGVRRRRRGRRRPRRPDRWPGRRPRRPSGPAPPGAACESRKVTGRRPGADGRALGGLRRSARCYPCVDGNSRRRTPLEASVVTTAVRARSIPALPIRAGGSGEAAPVHRGVRHLCTGRTACAACPAVAGTSGELTRCIPGSPRSCAPTPVTTPTAAARGSAPPSAEPGNACERQVGRREHCRVGAERAVAASRRATT